MTAEKKLFWAFLTALILAFLYWLYPSGKLTNFILTLRAKKLLIMLLLSYSCAVSTIIFQTISENKLLTPNLMGMDAIYLLLNALLIALLGVAGFAGISATNKFLIISSITMLFTSGLFVFLLNYLRADLFRLLLVGVVFSVFCRSLTSFIGRILDPNAYAVFQAVAFAQISTAKMELLVICLLIALISFILIWNVRFILDVLALGKNTAINLGISYKKTISFLLLIISILVSSATALVGPMLFFGLLTSALTYRLAGTYQHQILIPFSVFTGFSILCAGEIAFERFFNLAGTLSMAVESLGGIVFLILILRGIKK